MAAGWLAAPRVRLEARLWAAERAVDAGRLDEAEARLVALIDERPPWTRPRLLFVRVARRRGRITEAEDVLQRAVELGLPVDQGRKEHALLASLVDFRSAERSLRRVIEADPADVEAHRALAEGYARAGRWHEAVGAYDGWLEHASGEDRDDALRGRGRAITEAGRVAR